MSDIENRRLLSVKEFWGVVAATFFVFFPLFLVFIYATGSTFGQRCAVVYEEDSMEWESCVHLLANGKISYPEDMDGSSGSLGGK